MNPASFSNQTLAAVSRLRAAIPHESKVNLSIVRHPATPCSGFTMVEIALCLAIVGFALVAIIGVLPAGLNVQKENREDTILTQDATVWMDAIRSGAFGSDALTNYMDRVVVISQNFDTNGPVGPRETFTCDRTSLVPFSGTFIVGLLSTPRHAQPTPNGVGLNAIYSTNYVYAYARAMSGSAVEKAPQTSADVRDLAFAYRMVVDTLPVGVVDPALMLTNSFDAHLRRNLADVRLLFRWPLKQAFRDGTTNDPGTGNGRMVYRTQLGGDIRQWTIQNSPFAHVPFYSILTRDYQ